MQSFSWELLELILPEFYTTHTESADREHRTLQGRLFTPSFCAPL